MVELRLYSDVASSPSCVRVPILGGDEKSMSVPESERENYSTPTLEVRRSGVGIKKR